MYIDRMPVDIRCLRLWQTGRIDQAACGKRISKLLLLLLSLLLSLLLLLLLSSNSNSDSNSNSNSNITVYFNVRNI